MNTLRCHSGSTLTAQHGKSYVHIINEHTAHCKVWSILKLLEPDLAYFNVYEKDEIHFNLLRILSSYN